jgi:hypothetical protein
MPPVGSTGDRRLNPPEPHPSAAPLATGARYPTSPCRYRRLPFSAPSMRPSLRTATIFFLRALSHIIFLIVSGLTSVASPKRSSMTRFN